MVKIVINRYRMLCWVVFFLGCILSFNVSVEAGDGAFVRSVLFSNLDSPNIVELSVQLNPGLQQQSVEPAARDARPFLKSLLLPGWGQISQGRKEQAVVFLSLEGIFWGGMLAVHTYGSWLEDDYKAYAEVHAGIEAEGKGHEFFVDIGNYSSVYSYNQIQQLERDWDSLYLGEGFYWQWDSDCSRRTFEDMRIKSDTFKNSVIYFAGAIVANHLIAAIDAARHSRIQDKLSAVIELNPDGTNMLTFIKDF